MTVRTIEGRDIGRLLWIESIAWRNGVQFGEAHFRSQIGIFPEGQLCFENEQGAVWGFVNLMRFRFSPRRRFGRSWGEITADGYITSHDTRGNWLFGVNLSVHPHGYFSGATEALLVAAAKVCASLHLKGIVLGGRMPGYARWLRRRARAGGPLDGSDITQARAYMETRVEDENGAARRLEPQLELYESFGLRILAPIPGYMPDEKSGNFGVAMTWANFLYFPYYLCPSRRVWDAVIYGPVGRMIERAYLGAMSRDRRDPRGAETGLPDPEI